MRAGDAPILLKRVTEPTNGASLAANIMPIKHDAAVGAAIAVELARLAALPGGVAGAGLLHWSDGGLLYKYA